MDVGRAAALNPGHATAASNGLTQKDVEERSGAVVPHLSSLEADAPLPTLTTSMRLADALGWQSVGTDKTFGWT